MLTFLLVAFTAAAQQNEIEKMLKSIEFVKQNYSWDVIAKKTVDLYSELSGYSK